MRIADALRGMGRIFLDTAPVIYFVEQAPTYLPIVTPIFSSIDAGQRVAVTSPVTLAEALVLPYRSGNLSLVQDFVDVIAHGNNTMFSAIDADVARDAAQIRAQQNLLLPDALQAAIALRTNCDALLTNDPAFRRVPGLRVLLIDDLEL